MASVSSLDQDMRKLRMERYTPGAAKEVRQWIESTLGQSLPPGDLMDVLRDGVALCKYVDRTVLLWQC
jgi:transgelin